MKNSLLYIAAKTFRRGMIPALLIITVLFLTDKTAIAQDVKDSASKISFTMNLGPIVTNGVRSVKVRVSRKENGKTMVVADLKSPINLYLNEVKDFNPGDGTGLISKTFLNLDGEGIFDFPPNFNSLTSGLHQFTFIAKMDADPKYEDAQEEITVSDAKISLDYAGEDSIKTVTAKLTAWKDTAYIPVTGVELKLCIKRTFNFLPFGESGATTSETGEISGELPLDLPGNANKTLTIAGRLEEDETYGTVEVTSNVPWAILPKVNPVRGRTLWSSGDNAPLLLVITSLTIIVVIWGTIFYLVSLLFKIKRLSKN